MSLAIDLAALCECGGENGINRSHLAVFSEDVAFAHHCMAPCPPTPYRSTSGIGYAGTRLSKMVSNSASYPVYSRHSELP